jgi:hypothetical protein
MFILKYFDVYQSGLPITLGWLGMSYLLWRFIKGL